MSARHRLFFFCLKNEERQRIHESLPSGLVAQWTNVSSMSRTSVIGGVSSVLSGMVKTKLLGSGPSGGRVAINSQLKVSKKKNKIHVSVLILYHLLQLGITGTQSFEFHMLFFFSYTSISSKSSSSSSDSRSASSDSDERMPSSSKGGIKKKRRPV